jgi:mannose-6-phosphate isomerase-like protein (cupin superfamily)
MAYIFHQDQLPKLVSVVPGRERIFFVNKELTNIDDMLAGVMYYKSNASSPFHLHENCEHFYFIIEGKGTVETPEGVRSVEPGSLVFIPPEAKHRLRATETGLFYFEFQAPNRFKTTILDGTPDDLRWDRVDGGVWVQT